MNSDSGQPLEKVKHGNIFRSLCIAFENENYFIVSTASGSSMISMHLTGKINED